ncbi:hypothetical protein ACFFQF_20105 [Haladaptatus pallidirubidus]|uniref:hypothetical protein n=1 Tax=Haladaptatus pallidirubidus TaxID=1008152 RepID=UPI001D1036AE|nr:hypothetical protein [Haladaptatus pallidirubidus]
MVAVGVAVNVMQAGASHQFFNHVVSVDDVLLIGGRLVDLIGDLFSLMSLSC